MGDPMILRLDQDWHKGLPAKRSLILNTKKQLASTSSSALEAIGHKDFDITLVKNPTGKK
jgi:hypothetical protein